jgi:hypothetical protein
MSGTNFAIEASLNLKQNFNKKIRDLKGAESLCISIEVLREFKISSNLVHNSLVTPRCI